MKTKTTDNSIVKGTLSLSMAILMTKILGVIYKVPLSHILGDEGMGYFNSAYTLYGLFYIVSSTGIPKAITMIICENINNNERTAGIYKFLMKLATISGLLLTMLFLVLSPCFSRIFGSNKITFSLLLLSPSILIVTVSGVVRGYLNAKLKLQKIAISQLLEGAVKLILGLSLAILGKELLLPLEYISALTILGVTSGSLVSLVYMYYSSKSLITKEITRQKCLFKRRELVLKAIKISFPITLSSTLLTLGSVFDLVAISRELPKLGYTEKEAISVYGNYTTLSVPMINLVVAILTPIAVALLPKIVSAKCNGDKNIIKKELTSSLRLTGILSAACAMGYFFYPYEILNVLYNKNSALSGAILFSALAPSAFLIPVLTILNTTLEGLGRIRASLYSMTVSVLFKAVSSFLLIRISNIGVLGIPISTTMSYVLAILFSLYFLSKEGISHKIAIEIAVPIIFAVFSFYLPHRILYNGSAVGNTGFAIFVSVISILIYTIMYITYFSTFKKRNKIVKNAQYNI